jgi:nicotinate-nucleotide adenylyltransferase
MKRIGIYGGTFDPPHRGHIIIAEQAKKQLELDCVYFIPAYIPPHKQQHSSTTAQQRMSMMKLAVKGKKKMNVSSIELQRRGISYTVDTLNSFKRRFPKAELVLIIGADNLAQFQSWKSPHIILKNAALAVYKRKGFTQLLKGDILDCKVLKGPMLRISSTDIRKKIERGYPIGKLVPRAVVHFIQQHSLYSVPTDVPRKRLIHENHRVF